jgi:hypothetical protein
VVKRGRDCDARDFRRGCRACSREQLLVFRGECSSELRASKLRCCYSMAAEVGARRALGARRQLLGRDVAAW